ncbi:hypothetical protein [Vibrio casei]|uniref:hypothetical protein n=1 Tax=Vibrio casei TaxID=673372 RepID=UPI000B5CD1DD|nr:hypothetical protein [Vibrio casei]
MAMQHIDQSTHLQLFTVSFRTGLETHIEKEVFLCCDKLGVSNEEQLKFLQEHYLVSDSSNMSDDMYWTKEDALVNLTANEATGEGSSMLDIQSAEAKFLQKMFPFNVYDLDSI